MENYPTFCALKNFVIGEVLFYDLVHLFPIEISQSSKHERSLNTGTKPDIPFSGWGTATGDFAKLVVSIGFVPVIGRMFIIVH